MLGLDSLQRALDTLAAAIGATNQQAVQDVFTALGTARDDYAVLESKLSTYQDASASRERGAQDWQALLAGKEGEVVRLRGEVNRMRQALASTNAAHAAQADEVAALQAQLQQALALSRAQQRQAVVTTSASETASGDLHRLRAELDARGQQVARLEAEANAAQAAASARLAEAQAAFLAKIADLRKGHDTQLEQLRRDAAAAAGQGQGGGAAAGGSGLAAVAAAASAAAAAASTELQAQIASLQQRLQQAEAEAHSLRQRLQQQPQPQQLVATPAGSGAAAAAALAASQSHGQGQQDLPAQLAAARAEADGHKAALSSLQFGEKALKARLKELEGQLVAGQRKLAAAEQQLQQQGPGANGSASAALPGVDLSMLGLMEGQLARLSEIIRSREAEVAQLRAALQAGLDERRAMAQQIEALQQQMLAQQGGGGGAGGSGASSPKSSNSAAALAGPPRLLVGVSPNRPLRTGLHSKPRFK